MREETDAPLQSARERATRALTDRFVEGDLDTAALERLLSRVHAAMTADEVERVVSAAPDSRPASPDAAPRVGSPDSALRPAAPDSGPPSATADSGPPPATADSGPPPAAADSGPPPASAADTPGARALASPDEIRDHDLVFAYQDGSARDGVWTPARHTWVLNAMGGSELDFREARLGPGVTEVSIFSFLGGVGVVVPPGVQVEFRGRSVLGAFELGPGSRPVEDPGAPILRIDGVSVLSGVEVSVRLPGESGREAKRRRERLARESEAGALPPVEGTG